MDTAQRQMVPERNKSFSRGHRLSRRSIFRSQPNLHVESTVAIAQLLRVVSVFVVATCPTIEAAEALIDVQPTTLPHIEPGTVVEDHAPKGWSHLILKSQPRVAAGDIDKVPNIVLRHSDFLFTAFAADVARDSSGAATSFWLKRVGAGLGTQVKGKPTIVSSRTHRALGADLGLLRATVLSQSEKQLNLTMRVARTPTMVVFDAPGYYAEKDRHVPIALRYHVLVDAATGQLNTVTWLLKIFTKPPRYEFVEGTVRLLKPSVVEESVLHVDANEFIVGVPKPSAFALSSLPPGTELPMSPSLRRLADRVRFSTEEVVTLERLLWQAIQRDHPTNRR